MDHSKLNMDSSAKQNSRLVLVNNIKTDIDVYISIQN